MSHYSVLVISRKNKGFPSVRDLMEPYDENLEVDPYVIKTREEVIDEMKEKLSGTLENQTIKEYLSDPAAFESENGEELVGEIKKRLTRYYENLKTKYKDEDYIKYASDEGVYDLDDDGNAVSTYNTESKWDWYDVGGRWAGLLPVKGSKTGVDSAEAREVDWKKLKNLTKAQEEKARKFWRIFVEGKAKDEAEEEEARKEFGTIIYKPAYYTRKYKTVENYVATLKTFSTYAVCDEKGWYEPGEMGWFGCSLAEDGAELDWELNYEKRFIDTLDPEDKVYIVDCHI